MKTSENVMVSICTITYKHAEFIRETIEGGLMQETNFSVEFIIADDNSPDDTDKIVKEYIENHPKGAIINYVKHFQNKGMLGNFVWALQKCTGKYIALCEGDDYWTDPLKLQKQVDYLEDNNEVILTHHPVAIKEKQLIEKDFLDNKFDYLDQTTSIYDLAVFGNYIRTPSVVFRNINYNYTKDLDKSGVGDFFVYMKLAQYGSIFKLTENMGVYRNNVGIHSTSTSTAKRKSWIQTIRVLVETIENKKIKQILKNKIGDEKSVKIILEKYGSDLISRNLTISQLFGMLLLKINRKLKVSKK